MMSFDWSSMPSVHLDRKSPPARPLPGAALDDLAECRDIPELVQSMMYLLEDEVGVVARSAARRRSCWNGSEEALAW